jgi:multifunctional 2-oxoglutarate metabolism enzyme
MAIDFEAEFGVNAGYVEALYERWRNDRSQVDPEWNTWFEHVAESGGVAPRRERVASQSQGHATLAAAAGSTTDMAATRATPVDREENEREIADRLKGVASKIADNMMASLEVPTATSVRTIPVKVLHENRQILNSHMKVRVLGKTSYTHLIAYALTRAIAENMHMIATFEERDGVPYKVTPKHVNLGIAIDVETAKGRSLLVPNIKAAETLGFKDFHRVYEELVARARAGKLAADDFHGTNVTLSNPGGLGTHLSVPRLMKGQGLIIATGAIGVPTEAQHMAVGTLAELAIGPVMTVTSTYDHRVIQGAESGLLLQRVEQLLLGESHFYETIFRELRVPWLPVKPSNDVATRRRDDAAEKQTKVWELINAYRTRGCRIADLDPLEYKPDLLPSLDPAFWGFTVWDLDREFYCGGLDGKDRLALRDILNVLADTYCRRWTIEYMHIANRVRQHWLRDRVELHRNDSRFDLAARKHILELIYHAENFERFLHTRYVGNKRFSLEGAESLIPAVAEVIERAAESGIEKVVIGMAHRGRLNVLANILGKSYESIFREFEGVALPLSSEGSGDVKYHLGQMGTYTTATGKSVEVVLSANPSHLEAVDPVVCGMARGYQDVVKDSERSKVLAVLIHGDAAFSGQGVVYETLQMSGLRANECGGTVHIVVNNQIGFTASPRDLKSTYYCTDMAKGLEAPILHANGDYPESVLNAVGVALDYQQHFHRDVVIDLVCYRRWGHNEGDEPAYTQPAIYKKIRNHPTVAENYTALLMRRKQLTREEADAIVNRFNDELRDALTAFRERADGTPPPPLEQIVDLSDDDPRDYLDALEPPKTAVDAATLVALIDKTNAVPPEHVVHPNLLRQLRRREAMVRGEQEIDWGCAEALAFGSILEGGTSIRINGQDCGRGTFSQRHAVIRDQVSEKDYIPLANLPGVTANFEIYDSLLSEEAALAFEYGYSVANPNSLSIWEAQFGDFVNGAQIPIDQFIASSEAKWRQLSGIVLLLPHGYDGQGPEHSSGRIERFLALCADGNMTVANCTTAAQYFHLLRRHATITPRRPLVVFTPKSLLRDPRAGSAVAEFTDRAFEAVIGDPTIDPAAARRVVFCSGKVYFDLLEARDKAGRKDVAICRVEQLYPFPRAAVNRELARYTAKPVVVWCQEEPKNMGAWSYALERFLALEKPIVYAGRPASASPATGSYKRHNAEQEYLLARALGG